MSDRPKIPRERALEVAESLVRLLTPDVERIIVAGSIRRKKPMVGDIELLFIPEVEMRADGLFDEQPFDLTAEAIENHVRAGVFEKRKREDGATAGWGPKNKLALHKASGIGVDLFSTTEENWWTSLVIRTGGKEMNLVLTTGANRLNRTLNAYGAGITDRKTGQIIRAMGERHVFELCGVTYREPEAR